MSGDIPPGSVASRFACYTMYLSYIACINNTPDDEERADDWSNILTSPWQAWLEICDGAGAPKHLVSEMDKTKFMELLRPCGMWLPAN